MKPNTENHRHTKEAYDRLLCLNAAILFHLEGLADELSQSEQTERDFLENVSSVVGLASIVIGHTLGLSEDDVLDASGAEVKQFEKDMGLVAKFEGYLR